MERLTLAFDVGLYLVGAAMALLVVGYVLVAAYEGMLTVIRRVTFRRRMLRRMRQEIHCQGTDK